MSKQVMALSLSQPQGGFQSYHLHSLVPCDCRQRVAAAAIQKRVAGHQQPKTRLS
jgi:hypothetical protein